MVAAMFSPPPTDPESEPVRSPAVYRRAEKMSRWKKNFFRGKTTFAALGKILMRHFYC
jgi:hypothetical protein